VDRFSKRYQPDMEKIRAGLLVDNPYIVPPPLPLVSITPRSEPIDTARTGADEDLPYRELNEPER
jgi:hypothetical protein